MIPSGCVIGAACADVLGVPPAPAIDPRLGERPAAANLNPASSVYQEALKRDRKSWILKEPCLRSALVVTKYADSLSGLYRLPAQGWDRRVAAAAERRLRGAVRDAVLPGRRMSRRHPTVDQAVLVERVAAELEGLRTGVVQGAQLLYDGLLIHSLSEGELCVTICEHLARPCIDDARVAMCSCRECWH